MTIASVLPIEVINKSNIKESDKDKSINNKVSALKNLLGISILNKIKLPSKESLKAVSLKFMQSRNKNMNSDMNSQKYRDINKSSLYDQLSVNSDTYSTKGFNRANKNKSSLIKEVVDEDVSSKSTINEVKSKISEKKLLNPNSKLYRTGFKPYQNISYKLNQTALRFNKSLKRARKFTEDSNSVNLSAHQENNKTKSNKRKCNGSALLVKKTCQNFNKRRESDNKNYYTTQNNKAQWIKLNRSHSNMKTRPTMNTKFYGRNNQGVSHSTLDNTYSQTCLSFNPTMKVINSLSKKRAITPSSNKILIQNAKVRMQMSRNSAFEDMNKGSKTELPLNYEKYEKLNTIVDQCNEVLTNGDSGDFDFKFLENNMYRDTIKETMNVIKEIENSKEKNMMKIYLWKKFTLDNQKLVESEVIKEFRSGNLDPKKYGTKKKEILNFKTSFQSQC